MKNQKQQPTKNTSSSSCLVMGFIGVVFFVLILGVIAVAGFFVLKYFGPKMGNAKVEEIMSNLNIKKETKQVGETVRTMNLTGFPLTFVYPKGQVTEVNRDTSYGAAYGIYQETSDDVKTVYDYYEALAGLNGWRLASRGINAAGDNGSLRLEENDFSFNADYTRKEGESITVIAMDIYADDARLMVEGKRPGFTTTGKVQSTPIVYVTKISTPIPTSFKSDDYMIADSQTRVITEGELVAFTPWELKVARNEIYARHGRAFVQKDLSCYFVKKSWYVIDPAYSDEEISSLETKNALTILSYERKIGSQLADKDSGCK